ncbi:hypothetical protein F8388_021123 [Cannabis sativa]|uniref:Zinc knuckle CX2CX4HX4C domain-containing protein n=1 Tax=Cannabis sativa TaxID=3483 RepID=A0A7J6GZD5_CANSA|nr:hypothetical protein F8388_021123 [Cannabis sativa]
MDAASVCNLFEDSVQISHNDITFALNPGEVDEPQEANQVLLGKIISRHRFGKAAIQGSLKLSWNAIKGWKWKELEEGIIQFTFARREDALNNLSNLKELASKASPVFELRPGIEDAVGMSSLRFRATIDLNKPIFSGFYLRRQRLANLWIQYKYEKLPKLCFKCGILTHDQSTCFKSPTVIKDAAGNFFPMFGVWLKNEAPEKSTFSSPLAKWFQDWVLQKKLCNDPTTRNLLKVQRAIENGDSAEARECRQQLPGKKRIVTEEDSDASNTQPGLVITQMSVVYLPGIGEIAPFGNNTKVVSIEDLQEATDLYAARKAAGHATTQQIGPAINKQNASGTMGAGENVSKIGETQEEMEESHSTPKLKKKSTGTTPSDNKADANNERKGESNIPYSNSILGSQAQYLNWPSKECWAQPKARELVLGALTIDKYFREPTLINPILDIEDFRVQEHLNGPRKRKASDGFVIGPSPRPSSPSLSPDDIQSPSEISKSEIHINHVEPDSNQLSTKEGHPIKLGLQGTQDAVNFSPGSIEDPTPSRRRGKGRSNNRNQLGEVGTPKRRGRPPKNQSPLAATPTSFKGSKAKKSRLGGSSSVTTHWEGREFDLKGVKCTIQHSMKYLITGEITSDPPGTSWLLLGLYGPPNKADKERFWLHVGDFVLNATSPMVLLGDMNGTLHDNECHNYNGNIARYAFDFRRMVHRAGLIDLGFQGPVYTWAKGVDVPMGYKR